MRQLPLIVLGLLVLAGCGEKSSSAAAGPTVITPVANNPKVLSVTGPGGEVSIGDPVAKAKTAFPIPKGATVHNETLTFAALGKEGWGYLRTGGGPDVTEVAAKDGKIIAIAGPTEVPKDFEAAAKAVVARLGTPLREASNKTALLYVWENGEHAHFYMQIKKNLGIFGYGTGHLVGPKDSMKMLMLNHEDPKTFVDMIDQVADQAGSRLKGS